VKQRLSRGRKLLHEEVVAFVEGTLSRSTPVSISGAVLAALTADNRLGSHGHRQRGRKRLGRRQVRSLRRVLLTIGGIVSGIAAHWLVDSLGFQPTGNAAPKKSRSLFWIFVPGLGCVRTKSPWEF